MRTYDEVWVELASNRHDNPLESVNVVGVTHAIVTPRNVYTPVVVALVSGLLGKWQKNQNALRDIRSEALTIAALICTTKRSTGVEGATLELMN